MELLFPLLILALLVPMFLGMRRQKRELAKTASLQDSLQIGDQVLTTSGIYGTVEDLSETTVDLEISEGIVTRWSRAAVREVIVDEVDTDEADEADVDHESVEQGPVAEETADQTQARLTKD